MSPIRMNLFSLLPPSPVLLPCQFLSTEYTKRFGVYLFNTLIRYAYQIDCKAGTTAKGQNLLANISTSRASLLQGQYNVKLTYTKTILGGVNLHQ